MRLADALDMLGITLTRLGRHDEGEAAALRSIAIRDRSGQGGHPSQATALRLLGKQYRLYHRKPAKALPVYQRALAIAEAKFGKDNPLTGNGLVGVGETLVDLGRHAEARAVLARTLAMTEKP